MAARKEILSDLSSKIAEGNIREAYRDFEELPIVDQIAVSISPGVGDAIAAFEVGEFGRRAKTNIQDKDRLGAAGNIALAGLAGLSLVPLFRFLRGAKAVTKTGTKVAEAPKKTEKPPVEEPLQLSAPKDQPEVELPEVLPFVTKPAKDLAYQTAQDVLPLQSKARKFLHGHYKKIDPDVNMLTPEDWVKTLTNPNNEIPLGELRLLNVLDELNQIHPKLIKEAAGSEKISKGFLDNYMARQQRDALQIRDVPAGRLQSPDIEFANSDVKRSQQQKLYFVRGAGEQRKNVEHYANLRLQSEKGDLSGNNAYVFSGIGFNKPLKRAEEQLKFDQEASQKTLDEIAKKLKSIDIKEDDVFMDIHRVQSDFATEVGKDINFVNPRTEADKTKQILRYNKFVDEINPIIVNEPGTFKTMTPIKATENIKEVGVKEFTLEPKDIEAITGRSYKELLDKSPEEIFYMLDETGKQKYIDVPNNPEALSQAYFKDLYKDDEAFIKLQNGARILKKALVPKADFENKYKIDPYFEKSTTNEMKLPVRTHVLQAYKEGRDGVHIGRAQAISEGADPSTKSGQRVLQKYVRGEKELNQIIQELGLGNQKNKILTQVKDTGTEFDGTYLKFTDDVKKAIEEQGINAFKLGGPVDIDKMLAEL
jgi:coenzyme F420-reducing hydrogenase delta subunit